MRRLGMTICILAFAACGGKTPPPAAPAAAQPALHAGLNIKHVTLYVDDQDKALHFYTDVLGFAKKDDVKNGPFRWLTVESPEEAHGTELQLALNDNPAAKAYQQAMFEQNQPATMFFTSDVKGEFERLKGRGAEFTMPPTDVTFATIAVFKDTCGNLIQITQLN